MASDHENESTATSPAMPSPPARCYLLEAPREIRDLVYHELWIEEDEIEYEFDNCTLVISYQHPDTPKSEGDTRAINTSPYKLPLWLFACKQIFLEGKERLYRYCEWYVGTASTSCTTSFSFGSNNQVMEHFAKVIASKEIRMQWSADGRFATCGGGRRRGRESYTPRPPVRCETIAIPRGTKDKSTDIQAAKTIDLSRLTTIQSGLRTTGQAVLAVLFSIEVPRLSSKKVAIDLAVLEHVAAGIDVLRITVGVVRQTMDIAEFRTPEQERVVGGLHRAMEEEVLRVGKIVVGSQAQLFVEENDGRWLFEVHMASTTTTSKDCLAVCEEMSREAQRKWDISVYGSAQQQ